MYLCTLTRIRPTNAIGGNRPLTENEILRQMRVLEREIDILKPLVVIAVDGAAYTCIKNAFDEARVKKALTQRVDMAAIAGNTGTVVMSLNNGPQFSLIPMAHPSTILSVGVELYRNNRYFADIEQLVNTHIDTNKKQIKSIKNWMV